MQLRYNQFVRKLHISRQELKPIKQSEKNDPKWIKYTKTAEACRLPRARFLQRTRKARAVRADWKRVLIFPPIFGFQRFPYGYCSPTKLQWSGGNLSRFLYYLLFNTGTMTITRLFLRISNISLYSWKHV